MVGLRRRRRLCGTLCLIAALAAACSGDGTDTQPSDDATTTAAPVDGDGTTSGADPGVSAPVELLRLGLPGVQSLDPVAASPAAVTDLVLADLLYDTLTEVDDAGRAVPGLATFAANADRTVWRFTLLDGVAFADGSPVTADDVVYSLQRVLDQGEESLAALRIETIDSITAAGPNVVDIALRAPSAVLPEAIASPMYAITDAETVQRYLAGGDQTPNASGEFTVRIEQARRMVLDRRQGSGPATVTIDLFEDETAALDAFLVGDVDWTVVPADRLGEALDESEPSGLAVFQAELFLGIDAGVAPMESAALRRAVALAIDRTTLADAVFGPTAAPLGGIVPAGVPGGDGTCRGPCGPDLEEASRLVQEAFPDGQDRPLRLLVDDSAAQITAGGVIEEQLDAAGIDVEVDSLEVETYQQLIAGGQQQMFVFGWVGVSRTPASFLAPLFSSGSPDNITGFVDEAIDLELAAATAQPIATVRARAWREVETKILERVPVVPLVQFRTVATARRGVSGIRVAADGSVDLSNVAIAARGDG